MEDVLGGEEGCGVGDAKELGEAGESQLPKVSKGCGEMVGESGDLEEREEGAVEGLGRRYPWDWL